MSAIADCVSLLKAWPELASTSGVTTTNCCSISGVSCSGNRITYMSLNGYSYSTANLGVKTAIGGLQINPGNPIPTALFELTAMGTLWMAGAGLTGPIPTGFAAMTQLVQLHIESNKLTGGFPDDWAQMKSLMFFHADDNLLSVLPTTNSIANGNVLLKTCLIQNNRFTGIVPDGWLGGNMASSWVDLWGNCLSGVGPELNARLCAVNCDWYDQQNDCPGVDTSFQSKCWEVNPSCRAEIKFPKSGGPVQIATVSPVVTTTESVVTTVRGSNATTTASVSLSATAMGTKTSGSIEVMVASTVKIMALCFLLL